MDEPVNSPEPTSSTDKNKWIFGLIAVALVAVVAGIALSGGEDEPVVTETQLTPVPDVPAKDEAPAKDKGADREAAPNISGPSVSDPAKKVSLKDFRGEPVVVQVWASWCPICNEEAPDIAAFQKENPDVGFLGVNVEDSEVDALAYKERHGLEHEFDISDPDRKVEGELGFTGQPNSMLVDSKGRIVQIFPGAVTKEQLEAALKQT